MASGVESRVDVDPEIAGETVDQLGESIAARAVGPPTAHTANEGRSLSGRWQRCGRPSYRASSRRGAASARVASPVAFSGSSRMPLVGDVPRESVLQAIALLKSGSGSGGEDHASRGCARSIVLTPVDDCLARFQASSEVLQPAPRAADLLEPELLLRAMALELVEREQRGAEDHAMESEQTSSSSTSVLTVLVVAQRAHCPFQTSGPMGLDSLKFSSTAVTQ